MNQLARIFLLLIFASATSVVAADEPEKTVSFAKQIRPILNKHCTECHGGVKQAADVSFVYRDQVVAPEGWIVEPGEPDDSELFNRIVSEDPDERMPPPEHGEGLSDKEVELVRQWITEGASWEQHWAYEKPQAQTIPEVADPKWCRNELDFFVLGKLESEALSPSPAARPERWLRRVTLDLTGLPPTLKERAAFVTEAKSNSEQAYERVVDRLLASPQFGERWASVWLDQVRYADSKGLGVDTPRTIWKYRDWVVDSLNDDLPYDQFTIKQIAGDLLPDLKVDDLIATAGHRLTQTNEEGGTDDEEFRIAAVLDRVNTTWQTWQGVTFGCVQCHSHPYAPIRHEEYYKFVAFFNNTADVDLDSDWPKIKAPVNRDDYAKATELDRQIEALSNEIWEQENALLSDEKLWQPLKNLEASTNKATRVEVETVEDHDEFYTVDTISKNTDITLKAPLSDDLKKLTAIRLTVSPLNPKKAVSDSEWGFVLAHLDAKLIVPGEKDPQPIKLARVIADEPEMNQSPQGSLNPESNYGLSILSRIHYPRSAAFVLSKPTEVPPGSRLQVTLKHRVYILSSFTLMIRRGHLAVSDEDRFTKLQNDTDFKSKLKQYWDTRKERDKIKSAYVPVLRERPEKFARPTHVFIRGLFLTKGDKVTPATPESFPPLPKGVAADRLALAKWLVSSENPLTARVAVNRIWAQLFGTGIVATEEDFGSSGEPPSHGELLDYLATRFQNEHAWSTKKLLREMVLSSTYRQSSKVRPELRERDPQNRWLASGPRFRLTSEAVRDQALAVSGLLNLQMGGAPVRPPIPAGVWKPFAAGDKWPAPEKDAASRYRRSIYTYTKRSIPYPMFASFDAPSREFCTPRRLRSNTPIQALMTLNDETFVECANALAERMDRGGESLAEKIEYGFLLVTCREPKQDEVDELVALAKSNTDSGLMPLAVVLLNLDEVLMK